MPIDFDEATRIINAEQRKLNTRHMPPTILRIMELMKKETLHICNVGPWAHQLERPSISVFVPPYFREQDKAGMGYVNSTPFPIIHRFARIMDEHEMTWGEDDGRFVLRDLIGVGYGMAANASLLRYGVFVPGDKEPTPTEIVAANAKLQTYLDELIAEARDAYDAGPAERKAVITKDSHHMTAARIRGIDEKWVHHNHTQESVQCKMCGKFNPAGVAKCQCGSIIDVDLYRKLMAEQEKMMEEVTRPKGK